MSELEPCDDAIRDYDALRAERDALRAEVSELRRAVIRLHTIGRRQSEDAVESWAIRQAANDLVVPFSEASIQAKIAEQFPDKREIEVRLDDDGDVDEIVAHNCLVHLEMLDRDSVWIGITTVDEKTLHVNIYAQIPPRRKRPVLTVQTREG